jgi:sulfotransferase
MSGLPRSGSSLLSALLNQNPEIYSGPSSPVLPMMVSLKDHLSRNELYQAYPKPRETIGIIGNLLPQYYENETKNIIIDKNRGWPNFIPFAEVHLRTEMKIICTVRNIDDILRSFLHLIKSNPFREEYQRINFLDEQLIKNGMSINDFNRCDYLMSNSGVIGQSLGAMSNAIKYNQGHKLFFVDYDNLIKNPQNTLDSIYSFLNLNSYEHNFDNIKSYYKENDAKVYGLPSMHDVKPILEKSKYDIQIPDQILSAINGIEFWRPQFTKESK